MPITRLRSASDLREEFRAYGRLTQFSTQAFDWLWDYLEQLEDDTGTPLEIDVTTLCCDYTEEGYDSIVSSYSIDLPEIEQFMAKDDEGDFFNAKATDAEREEHEEAIREAVLDYLNDRTVVLGYDDDSVLFAAF